MKLNYLMRRAMMGALICVSCTVFMLMTAVAEAGNPLWTFKALTPTSAEVPANGAVTILYQVTNQSAKPHTLMINPMPGLVQVTIGAGVCSNPFTLSTKGSSCILSLQANGFQLTTPITDGPVVCQQGSSNQCYRPSQANILNLTPASGIALPAGCITTGDHNIQCTITISAQTNFGFTNMTYALCRSAQCDYDGVQSQVTCSCQLIRANQGIYSASIAPNNYNTSKPVGNTVTSTYSQVNSSGESPTTCPSGPFANCFGATCSVNGSNVTCTCPVSISTFIAPQNNCNLSSNKIWSATSTSSFPSIEGSMLFIYNTFFGGNVPQ